MKYELLGDILIKYIKNNISEDNISFYCTHYELKHINLKSVKTLAVYAVLQFLKAKNHNIDLEKYEEYADYLLAKKMIQNTKLENTSFINLSKYSMIKQNKLILSTKCYKKLTLQEEINQKMIRKNKNLDLER